MMENNHFISDLLYIDLFRGRKVTDYLTDQVFFSDLLPTKCPVLYKALSEKLHEKGVHFGLLNNTKDIWCRDYMPIQIQSRLPTDSLLPTHHNRRKSNRAYRVSGKY